MNKPWSKEETIIAFNVYCKIPFKDCNKSHPIIIKYAKLLNRSPSALNMKVGNIGRLDPELKTRGITGLVHGAKMEKEVWDEFHEHPDRLAFESERLIAQLSNSDIEHSAGINTEDLPEGKERIAVIKQRINQQFFREAVISAYNSQCCISGVGNKDLLEACHIVDWSQDVSNRTNPKNGLCLNPFFHKAYDKFYVAITPDLKVVVSDRLITMTSDDSFRNYLCHINGKKIALPDKFYPEKDFLAAHYERYLKK